MLILPIVLACGTLASTGMGGIAPLKFRSSLHLLLGFSSVAVIAVALFDMLPEVVTLDGGGSHVPLAAVGFLAFFALERYTAMHRTGEHPHVSAAGRRNSASSRLVDYACTVFLTAWLSGPASRPVRNWDT